MQEDQKLMVEFRDYPNVLIRMLNNCAKEPHSHLAVFVMQHDVNARLDFIQVGLTLGHKRARANTPALKSILLVPRVSPRLIIHHTCIAWISSI